MSAVNESDASRKLQILKIKGMADFVEMYVEGEKLFIDSKKNSKVSKEPNETYGLNLEYEFSEMRKEVEPWLTALVQSEHLSLLTGAGFTTAIHSGITKGRSAALPEFKFSKTEIEKLICKEAICIAKKTKRGKPNFEDKLRASITLYEGLKIIGWQTAEKLQHEIAAYLEKLVLSILQIEYEIANNSDEFTDNREEYLSNLVSFLMSFASRTGTRDRLNVFTTNYDRVIEFGAELAGIRLIDRFIGTLTPIFRSSRLDVDLHYNPPGIRGEPRYLEGVARFSKLHGSLDWSNDGEYIRRIALPFGAQASEKYFPEGCKEALIYPRDAKDKETTNYPYVELFRDLAASICRPNSVIVTYGYSFGDDHINRIIRDMLTIPSTHLVIISYDDSFRRIRNFYKDSKRTSQISLLVGNHFGDLKTLVEYYLPKPAIDRTSIKMEELLRARGYGDNRNKPHDNNADTGVTQ